VLPPLLSSSCPFHFFGDIYLVVGGESLKMALSSNPQSALTYLDVEHCSLGAQGYLNQFLFSFTLIFFYFLRLPNPGWSIKHLSIQIEVANFSAWT
jgi:hypothetical protein